MPVHRGGWRRGGCVRARAGVGGAVGGVVDLVSMGLGMGLLGIRLLLKWRRPQCFISQYRVAGPLHIAD